MIKENLEKIKHQFPQEVQLIVVSKFRSICQLTEVYACGYKEFGENRVQEMLEKYRELPKDIQWHLIGHLQSNKVKYIAPFVHLIHSVDSIDLAIEINKQAIKHNRKQAILLQVHIAQEDTKYGIKAKGISAVCEQIQKLPNIEIQGLMGMASLTENENNIRNEFRCLKRMYLELKSKYFLANDQFNILSMGMSSDYKIAIQEGSTMVRIGSLVFEIF